MVCDPGFGYLRVWFSFVYDPEVGDDEYTVFLKDT